VAEAEAEGGSEGAHLLEPLAHVAAVLESNLDDVHEWLSVKQRLFELQVRHCDVVTAASTAYSVAILLQERGEDEAAAEYFAAAVAALDEGGKEATSEGDGPQLLLAALKSLAQLLEAQGRYTEAERTMERVVDISVRTCGCEDEATALEMHGLANIKKGQGKYAEAEVLFVASLKVLERAGHGMKYAAVLNNFAGLLEELKRYEEAEQMHRQALGVYERNLGPEHPFVGTALNNLAVLLRDQGRLEEAKQYHTRALAVRRQTLPREHPDVAMSLNNLAMLLVDTGNIQEAEEMARQCLEIAQMVYGEEQLEYINFLGNYGLVLKAAGQWAEAQPYVQGAHDRLKQKGLSSSHVWMVKFKAALDRQ